MKTTDTERRFTLRLSEIESQMIDKLKKELNINTDSGVIRHIILYYQKVSNELSGEKAKSNKLRIEKDDLKERIENFNNAFSQLQIKKKP